jgi:hypothetical protein
MASKVKHKRSSVSGKVPVAGDLETGELALNTTDGKVYLKKEDNSILDITATIFKNDTNVTVTDTGNNGKVSVVTDGTEAMAIVAGETQLKQITSLEDTTSLRFKSLVENQSRYVDISAPDSVTANYKLKLPQQTGTIGQSINTDGEGNLFFADSDLFGENRIYVADKGSDSNDGVTAPVKTIKKALQLSANLGQRPTVDPGQGFRNAKRLIDANRLYIQKETIAYINQTYPDLEYNTAKCERDVGLILDAVIYDIILGGNSRTVLAGESYLSVSEVILNQKTETLAGINFAKELSLLIVQNQSLVTSYQSAVAQIKYLSISGAAAISAITTKFNIVTSIIDTGVSPTVVQPSFTIVPVTVKISSGDFYIDNPIIVPDKVSIVGDSLRSVVVRPLNANKDMFRVRNGAYVTGLTFRDGLNLSGDPSYTFDWAVAFDDPTDISVDRIGYFGLSNDKPLITLSPYVQNCSIISFLGGNGCLVDGSKVVVPNTPFLPAEAENPVNLADGVPEQGKSMVSNAFTMLSFGGTGWLVINDAYAQIVSCFQIFMLNGSYTQSGGYLSITNSATNFGVYALRSSGYSQNSFTFDRAYVAAVGSVGANVTITSIGSGRVPVNQFILRIKDKSNNSDITSQFKNLTQVVSFDAATVINPDTEVFTISSHGFANGASVYYSSGENTDIPGLINNTVYYVEVINTSTFKLFNDDSLRFPVNITAVGSGTHTLTSNSEEYFVEEILSSHNSYQELTLAAGTYSFEIGTTLAGSTNGFINNAYVYSYDSVTRKLIISNETTAVGESAERILFTETSTITTVDGVVLGSPITLTNVATKTEYYTATFRVLSTIVGNNLISASSAVLNKINFHRPSIINSSSHTWEFSGSGTDYNALPQNGGVPGGEEFEQLSELPGRVYSSGTNELGDFKVGNFIVAENKTGEIEFRSRVSVSELSVLRLSLSEIEIEQFSADIGLGDNEPGGAQHSRISTQLAIRSFVANRLGNVLDKNVSTNAVPGAVVQLNSQGQINQDLLPPARGITTYTVNGWNNRLNLSEHIPAKQVIAGDNAVELYDQRTLTLNTAVSWFEGDVITQQSTTGYGIVKESVTASTSVVLVNVTGNWNTTNTLVRNTVAQAGVIPASVGAVTNQVDNYFLKNDNRSQFLLLNPVRDYEFTGINIVTGVNSGSQGQIIDGPYSTGRPENGIAVQLDIDALFGGTGYTPASGSVIYYNVPLTGGTGTGATANVTVTNGQVVNVELVTGGINYSANDDLSANNSNIGGTGTGFEVQVVKIETRLYVNLVGSFAKFSASALAPEFISDADSPEFEIPNVTATTVISINAQDVGSGGNVNYATSVITSVGHGLSTGDAVKYNNSINSPIGGLTNNTIYWINKLTNDTFEIYNNYASGVKITFDVSSTGTHTFTRSVVDADSNRITILNHGLLTGAAVKIVSSNPPAGLITNSFYFVGSITVNGFTLHLNKADALASGNGITINAVNITSTGSGTLSLFAQDVEIIGTVNRSSAFEDEWNQIISSGNIDASNIVSGIIDPTKLADIGLANDKTFLRGDSVWTEAVQTVRVADDSPLSIVGDFYTESGDNYYYNQLALDINKTDENNFSPTHTSIGAAGFSKLQFTASSGLVSVRDNVINAGALNGQSGAYYTNPVNLTSAVPVFKGGTGLTVFLRGDMLYSGANNSLTQLSIGPANSVMVSNGEVPSWSTSVSLAGSLTVAGVTNLTNDSASTSTGSGALRVSGGVGVVGAVNAGSNIQAGLASANNIKLSGNTTTNAPVIEAQGNDANINLNLVAKGTGVVVSSSDFKVDGSSLFTDQTEFNLIDQTVETINFGGAATEINVGADTGTFTVNNQSFVHNSTSNTKVATGTTLERPGTAAEGMVRYNTSIFSFEGYSSGAWTSLGGVKSVDGLTYIIAESSPGASNDELEFFAATGDTTTAKVGGWTSTALTVDTNLIVNGNFIVNGLVSTVNSNTVTVDDKNIELAAIESKPGLVATLQTGTSTVVLTSGDTKGLIPGMTLSRTAGTGNFGGGAVILSINSLTQLTLSVNHSTAGAITFTANGASNLTADGGGITVKGTTDKTFNWFNVSSAWTSSEHLDLASGKSYMINGTSVLNSTALGSSVLSSSLTSVGTISAGVWQGSTISPTYGGTGVNNGDRTITLGGNLTTAGSHTLTFTTTNNTNVTLPVAGTLATIAGIETFTNKTLTSPRIGPSLLDTNGNELIDFTQVTSAVNNILIKNAASGSPVEITTAGGDTNVSLSIASKGNGAIILDTGTGAGELDLKSGTGGVRIWDTNSTHYYRFVTGDRTANYDITLPAGNVTLTAGTMVPDARTLTVSTGNGITGGVSAVDLTADRAWTLGLTGQSLALHNLATNGVIVKTGTDTVAARTVTAGTGVTVTNGDGVSGNPTIAIGQAVATSSNVQFNSLGVGTAGSATAGEIRATNNITAYFSSDIRFKENIRDIPDALNKVINIGGKLFDWKDDYLTAHGGEDGYFVQKSDFGLVAQDVEKHFPVATRRRPDGTLAVDYEKMCALAFAAIAELTKEIEQLKSKL